MNPTTTPLFKGIALFTPGGDLCYCIDPAKQNRWHIHLCLCLQAQLGLPEPPHFLVPSYTATVDRWLNSETEIIEIATEIYPAVQIYQPLLNSIFNLEPKLVWNLAPWQDEYCNPLAIETYKEKFPQLWENHHLVIQVNPNSSTSSTSAVSTTNLGDHLSQSSYVLRLFVANNSLEESEVLKTIHRVLEQGLSLPYTLKVIDINQHPELAESFQIAATPTLVRIWPKPTRRIVGEFNNYQRVLKILTS